MPMTFDKTGEHMKGRPNGPAKVPEVEHFECPKGKGKSHELVNIRDGAQVKCRFCHKTWADLDEQYRTVALAEAEAKTKRLDAARREREARQS